MVVSILGLALTAALRRAMQCYNVLRAEVDKKQGKKYAEAIDEINSDSSRFINSASGVRILLILIFTVSATSIFGPILQNALNGPEWLTIILLIVPVLVLILVAGELIPFLLATMIPDKIVENFYWFALSLSRINSPFAAPQKNETVIPEVGTVELSQENADTEENNEIEIFQRALDFPDVVLRECMIPRTEISAIEESVTYGELVSLFSGTNYSRIIVYRDNIDRITGYVHSKDLFAGEKTVRELIREIDFFPEKARAQEVLTTMIKNKRSIAVVLDEFGGTAGIVTLEDLMEEIFGEISDELDNDDLTERELPGGEYMFSGRLEVKYINRRYDLEIPESEDYETLSGFITYQNENIPKEGDELIYGNLHFKVLKTTSNRIDSVSLRIVEQ